MKRTAAILFLLAASGLGAQESLELGFDGPRIVGADAHLGLGAWSLGFGAGYQELDLGRNQTTGQPTAPPSAGSHDTYLAAWVPDATLELKYTFDLGEALVWASAGLHGWGDFGAGTASVGLFPDWAGNLQGSVQAGVARNRMEKGPRGVVSGTSVRALVEAGPSALSLRPVGYTRAALRTAVLVPLWNLEQPSPLFAGTLGFRANAVWTDGDVPVPLLESTEVRGYHEFYDTKLRMVAGTELRLSLPSLWNDHDLVPVVLFFADGGYGAGYAKAPASAADRTVWLAGAGAGVGMNFFGAATPTIQFGLPLTGSEADFWWTLAFSLRF